MSSLHHKSSLSYILCTCKLLFYSRHFLGLLWTLWERGHPETAYNQGIVSVAGGTYGQQHHVTLNTLYNTDINLFLWWLSFDMILRRWLITWLIIGDSIGGWLVFGSFRGWFNISIRFCVFDAIAPFFVLLLWGAFLSATWENEDKYEGYEWGEKIYFIIHLRNIEARSSCFPAFFFRPSPLVLLEEAPAPSSPLHTSIPPPPSILIDWCDLHSTTPHFPLLYRQNRATISTLNLIGSSKIDSR